MDIKQKILTHINNTLEAYVAKDNLQDITKQIIDYLDIELDLNNFDKVCEKCLYFNTKGTEAPCKDCLHNHINLFTPASSEIEIGDIVVQNNQNIFGLVLYKDAYRVEGFTNEGYYFNWGISSCNKTNKHYSEIEKILFELRDIDK